MIFQISCFLLALYMSVSFVKRFIENENATSITYKKYSKTSDDKYPTISICVKGAQFHWYHDMNIYNAYELRPDQYETMLRGQQAFRYVYDPQLRLFQKIPTFVSNGSASHFS